MNTSPEYALIPLELVNEPPLPVRAAMDEEKMEELKESLVRQGQLVPIISYPVNERYEIVDGHRRFLALRAIGAETISAMVYPGQTLAKRAAMLDANLCREDITQAEEALLYQELIEQDGLRFEQLCEVVKRTPAYVSARLMLFQGDKSVFDALLARRINFAQARAVNRFEDRLLRIYWLEQAIRCGTPATRINAEADMQMPPGTPPPVQTVETPGGRVSSSDIPMVEMKCQFCGGDKDPYNLRLFYAHARCVEAFEQAIERAARAGEEAK